MNKLTQSDFNRARDFLLTQARPLEKKVFALEFEGGSAEDVFIELGNFQNLDGGFGQALEPDVRTPTSSALCTEIGLRYLAEREVSAENQMVKAAVQYLIDTFEVNTQVWRVIPVDANEYPHAPWWHDEDGSLAGGFDNYKVIPRAGILALLYHYPDLVTEEWLETLTEQTIRDIENLDTERFGQGGDTLVYALRLAEASGLTAQFKSRLDPLLRNIADIVVTRDPDEWSSYSTPPIKLAPTPQSSIADLVADDVQTYLDYLIERQTPDGTWEPTWTWGGKFPTDWLQARTEWRGILTLDTLIVLRSFDRLVD